MTERKGDWIQTFPCGIQFWTLDPRPEEVRLADIAHALSLQCRYGGHCREHYSVAEHSVRVSEALVIGDNLRGATMLVWKYIWDSEPSKHQIDAALRLAALMHDASEAYFMDFPRPVKRELYKLCPEIKAIFDRLDHAIARHFRFPVWMMNDAAVKRADNVVLMTEKRDLLAPAPAEWKLGQCQDDVEPLADPIVPWSSRDAQYRFLNTFADLKADALL